MILTSYHCILCCYRFNTVDFCRHKILAINLNLARPQMFWNLVLAPSNNLVYISLCWVPLLTRVKSHSGKRESKRRGWICLSSEIMTVTITLSFSTTKNCFKNMELWTCKTYMPARVTSLGWEVTHTQGKKAEENCQHWQLWLTVIALKSCHEFAAGGLVVDGELQQKLTKVNHKSQQ